MIMAHPGKSISGNPLNSHRCIRMPYAAGGGTVPSCPSKCADSDFFTRQKAIGGYAVGGVTNMQEEIMTPGTVQVAFNSGRQTKLFPN